MSIVSFLFGNIYGFLAVLSIISGGIIYTYYHFKPIKVVELLRPRDSRGKVLKVIEETDLGLTCKEVKGVQHRFIKAGRGWTFNVGGKMVTKFYGLEATAYTGLIGNPILDKIPLSEYLTSLWGKRFYETIPDKEKRKVEKDKMGVTIEIGKITEEDWNLPTLTADDIFDEGDAGMMKRFAKGMERADRGQSLINMVVTFVLGAMCMYFLINQGVI